MKRFRIKQKGSYFIPQQKCLLIFWCSLTDSFGTEYKYSSFYEAIRRINLQKQLEKAPVYYYID